MHKILLIWVRVVVKRLVKWKFGLGEVAISTVLFQRHVAVGVVRVGSSVVKRLTLEVAETTWRGHVGRVHFDQIY